MKRVAVIGSGPAGFYTSLKLLKKDNHIQVDMIEALPSPFGLIRYGVAPDHPEVKAVQNKFQTVTENKNFQFIGNVSIGKNVTLEELQQRYHVICLAIGAAKDRKLNIPGEDTLIGIHAARDFVSWYNGLPSHKNFDPKLHQSEEAVIIGQGNVALDIASIDVVEY